MPQVSFIIPYYNNGATIQETIDSIFNQSFSNFDIWIIDDGSTDPASLTKLQELKANNRITILEQANAGPSVARNLAIRQCTSQIIIPLDADDKILPGAIEKALPYFSNERIAAVYGDNLLFGEESQVKKQQPFNMQTALLYNGVAMCSFIRKAAFEKSGYFDEFMSLKGLEDWEMWIRWVADGWELLYLPETLFAIRVNRKSRTFETANKNLELLKAYVYQKHAALIAAEYNKLYYQKKMLAETPDYRIGNFLLSPYRALKRLLGRG